MKPRFAKAAHPDAVEVRPLLEGGFIPEAARASGFAARAGQACELWLDRRLLLVGVGPAWDERGAERAGALAVARLAGVARIAIDARRLAPDLVTGLAMGALLRAWREDRYRHSPADAALARIEMIVDRPRVARADWRRTGAVLRGVRWARRAVTAPSNRLTPALFCKALRKLERLGLELTVLKPGALRREGFGALCAVGGGSVHGPRLAVLRWRGRRRRGSAAGDNGRRGGAPLVFCGKGITFDTGGISIKPADHMWEMRADMAGAAACVGAMIALARRDSEAHVVAVLALAENATGGGSYRPGDVLRSVDGTTIEVIDTDAEGRLVLADALGWAVRELAPRALSDLATLTGSIVTALGHERAGLFDNDAALAARIVAAGEAVGERVWRMPIGERHRADLRSDIADIAQCARGRMQPDACQAAALLAEFVGEVPWAHLDIAGVEARAEADDRHAAGASGFGVRLLDRLVARWCEQGGGCADAADGRDG